MQQQNKRFSQKVCLSYAYNFQDFASGEKPRFHCMHKCGLAWSEGQNIFSPHILVRPEMNLSKKPHTISSMPSPFLLCMKGYLWMLPFWRGGKFSQAFFLKRCEASWNGERVWFDKVPIFFSCSVPQNGLALFVLNSDKKIRWLEE